MRVVDLGFDGGEDPVVQLECKKTETLKDSLRCLPLQLPRTVRGFEFNFHLSNRGSSAQHLKSYLADLGVTGVREPAEPDISNFLHLTSQWQDNEDRVWFGTKKLELQPDICAYIRCIPLENDNLIGEIQYRWVALSKVLTM